MKWVEINQKYAKIWPNITQKKAELPEAKEYDGVKEKLQSKSITGSGTFTFQCANGQVFHVASPAADFGCNFTDLTIDTDYATATTIVIDQGSTAYMPTSVAIAGSSATITWQGGSAPSGTANGIDVVTFSFLNVSSTVTVLGQSVSFS